MDGLGVPYDGEEKSSKSASRRTNQMKLWLLLAQSMTLVAYVSFSSGELGKAFTAFSMTA